MSDSHDLSSPPARPAPRLRQVCLVVPTLAPVLQQLQRLFGLGAAYADPHVAIWDLCNAVLPVGQQFLELVAPVRDDAPAQRFLARHPAGGGYMVILNDADLDARRRHLQQCSARLVTDQGMAGFHTLQVHPRDCGACMLEFNHTLGGEDLQGSYAPAGPEWQQQVRTGRVSAVAGVTLRGPDPQALAARWAALIGVPATQGAVPELALPGGTIRFAAAQHGAPEGLVAIDLVAADAEAVLDDARALGVPHDRLARSLQLAGVKFQLVEPV